MTTNNKTIILANALSVTNQSGLHVLAGHLEQLVEVCRVTVIARRSDPIRRRLGDRVQWSDAPESTSHWLKRSWWEFQCLEKVVHQTDARFYFTPSGIAASRLSIPQIVLCQNPWCLVPSARRRSDALKAWIQRRAYRKTMRRAELMVFNSEYMRKAYRENAGFDEKQSIIAAQAAEGQTRQRAKEWKDTPRVPGRIVCVSAMAPHKNVEAVIRAFAKLIEDPPRPAATP
ncbi:MAG TPA: glycosyltransferase, partial [Tichowtungia sp.]|nr:glycosyltransferase [Tichowtungia sp.]